MRALVSVILVGLLAPLAACDFDYVVVEVESRDLCIQDLVGDVPAGANGTVSAILGKDQGEGEGEEIPQEVDDALALPEGWEVTQVNLQGLTVRVVEGVSDLAFLDALRLSIESLDPAVDLPKVELVEFLHGANRNYNSTSAGVEIYVPGNAEVDLDEYFDTSSVELSLELEGSLPDEAWKLEVEPCFSFVAEYRREL